MITTIAGYALVLGDNVNTDEIHPSRFYSLDDQRVSSGFLEAVPGKTAGDRHDGGIIVAGGNFGCGSSRETSARVFLLNGVRAIVAKSFARIFQRNVINLGLPAMACPDLADDIRDGEPVSIDLQATTVRIGDRTLPLEPLDPLHRGILEAGGLARYLGLNP
jgi:3-isopropylmalate dehydratase small subunit